VQGFANSLMIICAVLEESTVLLNRVYSEKITLKLSVPALFYLLFITLRGCMLYCVLHVVLCVACCTVCCMLYCVLHVVLCVARLCVNRRTGNNPTLGIRIQNYYSPDTE
jgi:hypothetical protein